MACMATFRREIQVDYGTQNLGEDRVRELENRVEQLEDLVNELIKSNKPSFMDFKFIKEQERVEEENRRKIVTQQEMSRLSSLFRR